MRSIVLKTTFPTFRPKKRKNNNYEVIIPVTPAAETLTSATHVARVVTYYKTSGGNSGGRRNLIELSAQEKEKSEEVQAQRGAEAEDGALTSKTAEVCPVALLDDLTFTNDAETEDDSDEPINAEDLAGKGRVRCTSLS